MVDRRAGQLGCGAVAEAAADAVPPFRPARDDAGAHGLQLAELPHRGRRRPPWGWLEQLGILADHGGIDLVSLVAAELGTAEIADLGGVDDADYVARIVQRQCRSEAVAAGCFQADVGLSAAHGLEPVQHRLPALWAVRKRSALSPPALHAVGVQGILGHVDPKYCVSHCCFCCYG